MNPLVSIIIPCYNAERWIAEAIESALAQTYSPVEVIVIDDGSTDNTLKIVQSFGNPKIKWETGTNQGGNVVRNKGFGLSKGEYIQWLDADDYLLPEKIEHQAAYLQRTGCDIVYGDWRHQFHEENDHIWLGDIKESGNQEDILEALLSGWWAAPLAYLMKREIVEKIGGWDEKLRAGQDRDFWLRAAIAGAKFSYQSGCHSIYRRYGNVTVSTKNRKVWCDYHGKILEKSLALLQEKKLLNDTYKMALAKSHFHLARNYFVVDKISYRYQMDAVKKLDPCFRSNESLFYNIFARVLGFNFAENIAVFKRRFTGIFYQINQRT
jgi:glycosyltransferase involved in cell wall biosynthesis